MAYLLRELAELVGGRVVGENELEISGVGGVGDVQAGEITFAQTEEYFLKAEASPAAVIIVEEDFESAKTLLRVDNSRLAFAKIAQEFTPQLYKTGQIHKTAVIADDVELGSGVSIGPQVTIESGVQIGDNTTLAAGVYIGREVSIGNETLIHPQVVVEHGTQLGSEVVVQAGTVIGSDGYGFESTEQGHYKVPQLGNVIIEDRVELGANVTVDRGATGDTVVGQGTKVDNLVHIGHNVKIGQNCLIVAQVGISGSVELEDWVTLAGQVGVVGHLKIGANTTIGGRSVVISDVPADSFYSGYPARDHKKEMRIKAARQKLPEMLKELRSLKKEVAKLRAQVEEE
ncbi:UDP-3-O-(3-hydroxymyristoyl)glucosamine N-acyltransferase [Fuchsiella alkaliacetigena]|uniref:UDP-3-O-(3-hydroxymyristoyl)glucosamine N-acyltransferase n=1 Tax=Fuchsiella alkaliacetigena TaxID=957042 RepID=UPI00200A0A6E|nr:UDP-3-O-(3-hydroxymyristoyl)glucosamine N-acyltransferase [Fuchsiella alkaliacetigena]MCK8824562.1 UDP-3-O-(3-hydroxymyristoyl)glucosamine N-acyltransferase [Fuchsiella alkaliacetigena]